MDVDVLFHQGLTTLGIVAAPLLVVLLVVGIVTGVLQSATQINDPAVGFLPRLAAAIAVCYALGGWMVHKFAELFAHALQFGR
jgi:flagellar biosynthesis protein FliQ